MDRIAESEAMDNPAEAAAYAAADFADVNHAFAARFIELARPMAVRLIVDLGAGPADIPARLARHNPQWHVVAVDRARAMLVHGAARLLEAPGLRVTLVEADAHQTPLVAHCADAVVSNSILHHVRNPLAFWREVRRLGRPGALVFLRDLLRPPAPSAAKRLVRQYAEGESVLLQEEFYRSFLSAYTVDEVRDQLTRAGLAALTVAQVTDRHLDVCGTLPETEAG